MTNASPVPLKREAKKLTFSEAIQAIIDGHKVTRVDWKTYQSYGVLKDGFLIIHRDGKDFKWIVSEADMVSDDWIIISDAN